MVSKFGLDIKCGTMLSLCTSTFITVAIGVLVLSIVFETRNNNININRYVFYNSNNNNNEHIQQVSPFQLTVDVKEDKDSKRDNNNNNNDDKNSSSPSPSSSPSSSSYQIIRHIKELIEIGNSKVVYEESKSLAREYIRDYIIGHSGVDGKSIEWNRFEWSEKEARGRNITTTTWSGINIIVWLNSSYPAPLDKAIDDRIRVISCSYDTADWGAPNKTRGSHHSLASVATMLETIVTVDRYLKRLELDTLEQIKVAKKKMKMKKRDDSQSSKNDELDQPTQQLETFEDLVRMAKEHSLLEDQQHTIPIDQSVLYHPPIMFIFFDHEKAGHGHGSGSLGSKSFVKHFNVTPDRFSFQINLGAIGIGPTTIQTYPYRNELFVQWTPAWMIDLGLSISHRLNRDVSPTKIRPFSRFGHGICSDSYLWSVLYQAHRYHITQVPLLTDSGPFSWCGVDSMLLCDANIFQSEYDQLGRYTNTLDFEHVDSINPFVLMDTINFLIQFILSSSIPKYQVIPLANQYKSSPSSSSSIDSTHPWISSVLSFYLLSFIKTIFPSYNQYLAIHTTSATSFQLLGFNFVFLLVLYKKQFKQYRKLYYTSIHQTKRESSFPGYRIYFFHLVFYTIVSTSDIVFSFLMLVVVFPAMLLINQPKHYTNIFISIISSLISLFILYQDLGIMIYVGETFTINNIFMILFYLVHVLLPIYYSFDIHAIQFNNNNPLHLNPITTTTTTTTTTKLHKPDLIK
ncbi:hypothetical protein DFA_04339 [Cavenderia fasciculata]|uniref:Transmembrane protein n=1 Tax=Cavenderia fasciculata TaxID=261658 RepID=F4PPA8_CACFS|nr:uncharacterized protein DFA_04339 [Cavenderia fasciculata]EGG22221.1 hypothetical protein DFA_04339 [Cavenderia fasciculata]|eukprot:XP_004360072.1 hypothetical protein DFA_04339 [Cavenderia fasciculata]